MSIIAQVIQCSNCGKDLTAQTMPFCSDCAFNNQFKINNMNTIFKEGDTVFDFQYGKGKIILLIDDNVNVDFEDVRPVTFSQFEANIRLSFTPYDLIKGGFSQERPKPEIEKGTVIYVKDRDSQLWKIGYFDEFKNGYVFIKLKKEVSPTLSFDEYSLENPLI